MAEPRSMIEFLYERSHRLMREAEMHKRAGCESAELIFASLKAESRARDLEGRKAGSRPTAAEQKGRERAEALFESRLSASLHSAHGHAR